MKKLLILPLFVLSLLAKGQYDPSKATVTNKPIGIAQGVPTDARSYFFSTTLLIWRPYQSTAEVLATLNVPKFRAGNFPIFINIGGALQTSGSFIGGTIKEYWFKDGVSDADLVEKVSGGGETTSGTVAQLRALSTTTGRNYTSTDLGGGNWADIGPFDGQVTDDGASYLVTANNKVLKRQANGEVYAKWFTTGNGSANNTTALQAAISKGGNVFLTESYVVSNTLTVPSNTHIIGLKGASIFVANNTNKILFNIVDATNVSIEGLTIDGNIANQSKSMTDPLNLSEFWSGVNILNSQNVTISNNIIKNCNGDGVTMEGRYTVTGAANTNKNIKVTNNTIFHCGRNGVSAIHVDGFELSGNTIYDQKAYTSTLGTGIDIEPNVGNGGEVWIARNGSIFNNIIYDNNEGVMLAGSPVVSSQIFENIKIETNGIYSNKHRNIYAFSLDAAKFKTSGVIISGNNLKGDSSLTNSAFFNSCHSNINFNNNDLSNATTPILVYRSSELSLFQNSIEDYGTSGGGSGIELFGSSNCIVKLNKIRNGNTNSSFLYGIVMTSTQSDFENADNNIEGNIMSVTKPGKYMFAGLVGVSNNASWDVIKRNKINGNTLDGITAANLLFVNSKTNTNQIGVNFTQSIPLVPDHSVNTLVPYNFIGDRPTATTDLPLLNNDEGVRRFDNIKKQPTWWNGSSWVTGLIDGYNYGAKEITKTLTSNFPDGVANQKIDILLPSASFLGDISISLLSSFIGTNAAGIISKRFSVGYNPGGVVFSNNSRYTEAVGGILDNFSISDLSWDASLSKYKITINHLQPITNPVTVKIQALSIDTASVRNIYENVTLGSVYVGLAAVPDAAVEYKNPVRGVPAVADNQVMTLGQLKDTISNYGFTIRNAVGSAGNNQLYFPNSATAIAKQLVFNGNVSEAYTDTTRTVTIGAGTVKVLPDANYTITSSDYTLILAEPASSRTLTLPAASTMPNKSINISCRASTTGRWILSGSFVQKITTGTDPIANDFVNSGLTTATNYHLVSDGVKWYDISN